MDASRVAEKSRGGEASRVEGIGSRSGPVHPGEWLILLAAAAALLVRCIRDRARPLWCDEA